VKSGKKWWKVVSPGCYKRLHYSAGVFGRRNYLAGGGVTLQQRQRAWWEVVKSGEKLFRLGAASACIIPPAFSVGGISMHAAE
jgi:hypothetical protein